MLCHKTAYCCYGCKLVSNMVALLQLAANVIAERQKKHLVCIRVNELLYLRYRRGGGVSDCI